MWRHVEIESALLHWDLDVLVMGSETDIHDEQMSGAPVRCVRVWGVCDVL